MVDRRDVSSWLQGPGRPGERDESAYPGRRLGYPEQGPGSIARFGRRFAAVLIDWLACKLVAYAFFHVAWNEPGAKGFIPLGIFALENLLLISTTGSTLGQRIMGLQVRALSGGRASVVQVLTRTGLLCLFIPAVIWDADGRGVHDKVPNTVILRTR